MMNEKQINDFEKVMKLKTAEFIRYIKSCSDEELRNILNNKQTLLNTPIAFFNIILLNSPTDIKIEIFKDRDYLKRIIQIPKNRINKTFFELLNEEEQVEFLKNKKMLDEIDENLFFKFIKLLKYEQIKKLEDTINNFVNEKDCKKVVNYLTERFSLNKDEQNIITNKLTTKNRNIFGYLLAENVNEVFIYNKFKINLKISDYDGNINTLCFDDNQIIEKEELEKINEKHMNLLIERLIENKKMSAKEVTKAFIGSLRMYETFGFDNAMKILNGKFSSMNSNALKKYAKLYHTDERRQYRLENQAKFYSYEMLQKTKEALKTKDLYFFTNICKDMNDDYLMNFFKKLKQKVNENPQNEDIIINEEIQKEIKEREDRLEEEFVKQYCQDFNFKQNQIFVDYNMLYKMFKNVSIRPNLDKKGRVIPNEDLDKFLLGNKKQDNDCLLRLIFNKKAFGLNQNLDTLINSFEEIKKIATRKTNNFSLYSILDVIDICKSTLYKLKPDEQDMTLETITKIQNATQYCHIPKEEILLRAKELHKERRKKVYATIPTVHGQKNDIKYQVLPFDSESLITSGIDTGSCLRVGGLGEDFLRYCMTNPNAVIVSIKGKNDKQYICPFIRNGNGIYGNGIDPKPETEKEQLEILEALQKCVAEIIEKSNYKEPIEFATITDLHYKKFLNKRNLKKIEIDRRLQIGEDFYSDLHKEEMKTYIIASTKNFKERKYYVPIKKYYQERIPNYVYNTEMEKDKERIELLINSIKYSSIDFQPRLTRGQKNTEKRNFRKLKVENFEYIIGNKDWFIAIDDCLNITSYRLPYGDKRANEEYLQALISLQEKYNIGLEGKTL